ncbi:hypothetical protein QYE76_027311 [Lolium multiflorum]|uniref:RNase H type-1 domain-containing protein n=1 Tax=Lolium multiflorum TaxID=4521 RepID=A0AAD8QIX3_LOLMU|nr:hypothetical protein QYE76_027311 [Lolium multiflorum]
MEVNAVMPAVPKYMLWSDQEISWSFKDHPKIMPNPGGYALVVDPIMHGPNARVKFSKVLIDNGSSINIMYRHTMRTLGITENMLQPTHTTFHGIVPGLSCSPMGKVRVDVSFGGHDSCRVENLLFEVVDLDSPYHALLGRPALAAFMASTHTAYLKMKMSAPRGPLTVVGNYKLSLAAMSGNLGTPAFKPTNETKDIVLDPAHPERTVRIGVPRELAEHCLNVRKDAKPVRQPLRRFAEDRRKIIGEEVTKLLVAGFIVEVLHTEWLANPMMVEKKKEENLEAKAPKCSGDWDAKDANMASYQFQVQKISGFFEGCEFHHVPRAENEAADALSKLGSSRQEIPPGIALAHLREPSIKPSPESESIFIPESHVVPMDIDEVNPRTAPANSGTVVSIPKEAMLVDNMDIDVPVFLVREAPSWVKPIKEFLINGTLSTDENESRRIQRRSKAYTIINGEVYKRSVTGVLQRCVEPEEGKEMLWRFTKENVGTMLHRGRWLQRYSGTASIGSLLWRMLRI